MCPLESASRDGSLASDFPVTQEGEKILPDDGLRSVDEELLWQGRTPPDNRLFYFILRPRDGLPVGCEDLIAAGEQLDAIPTWLEQVDEKRLCDTVFPRSSLDGGSCIGENVGCAKHIFTVVEPVGKVVETTILSSAILHHGDVMHLRRDGKPACTFDLVVKIEVFT